MSLMQAIARHLAHSVQYRVVYLWAIHRCKPFFSRRRSSTVQRVTLPRDLLPDLLDPSLPLTLHMYRLSTISGQNVVWYIDTLWPWPSRPHTNAKSMWTTAACHHWSIPRGTHHSTHPVDGHTALRYIVSLNRPILRVFQRAGSNKVAELTMTSITVRRTACRIHVPSEATKRCAARYRPMQCYMNSVWVSGKSNVIQ